MHTCITHSHANESKLFWQLPIGGWISLLVKCKRKKLICYHFGSIHAFKRSHTHAHMDGPLSSEITISCENTHYPFSCVWYAHRVSYGIFDKMVYTYSYSFEHSAQAYRISFECRSAALLPCNTLYVCVVLRINWARRMNEDACVHKK